MDATVTAVPVLGTPPRLTGRTRPLSPRAAAAVAVFVAVLAITGWIAPALGAGLLVAAGPWLFGGRRAARDAMNRLDALAMWTESLRDRIWAGTALPDALIDSPARVPASLRPELNAFAHRLAVRDPLDQALDSLAEDLADPAADMVIATLILNVRTSGSRLVTVLSSLSTTLRAQLADRREIDARQAESRQAVRLAVAITIGMLVALTAFNPTYVAPYRTPDGQLVLGVVVALYGGAFVVLRRLADYPPPPRLLAHAARSRSSLTSRTTLSATRCAHQAGYDLLASATRVSERLGARGWPGLSLRADLALTGSDPARLVAEQIVCGIVGLLVAPTFGFARWTTGDQVGLLPLWFALLGAATGAWLPHRDLRLRAAARRDEFAAVTGTYLDLVAMRLASGAGLAEAVQDAADVGRGPVFVRLRVVLDDARLAGLSYPDALDRFGQQTDLPDLRDLAATLAHVELSGAHAETTLRDKAGSMRDRQRTAMHARAARRTQTLSLAQALLGLGFLIFVGYPALTVVGQVAP
jgi:Flp pilus assembly protein TadB